MTVGWVRRSSAVTLRSRGWRFGGLRLRLIRPTGSTLLQRARKVSLKHSGRHAVGFLQIDAPVFQFVERNPCVRDGATHIGSRRDHAEIAVEILHLRFAMARGTEFIQHDYTPAIPAALIHRRTRRVEDLCLCLS